jgi:uncharacterized protein YoxC
MKKYSKSILTIIVTTILTLSFVLPFVSVHAAIAPPSVTPGPWQVGDKVWVNGSASEVTSGATVEAYWDIAAGASAHLLNSTTGKADGSYEMLVTVPEAETGTHYIWVKDVSTGGTAQEAGGESVIPTLEVDPEAGLPDDTVTLMGTGFSAESGFNVSFFNSTAVYQLVEDNDEETDEYGSFSISVDVPSPLSYGSYWFNVTDDTTSNETVAFELGASIVLDFDEGPEGSVVGVSGRGFTNGVQINESDVSYGGVAGMQIDGDDMTVDSNGEFTGDLIIPTMAGGTGDYVIVITDGVNTANDTFTVDGVATIDVNPTYGSPGATITVEGWNFTQIAGLTVNLDLNGTSLGSITTDANGEFITTFTVPAVAFDQFVVNATMDTMLNEAMHGFKVGIIAIIISPTSGPTGTKVTLTGTGFETGDYNATLGDEMVIEGGAVSLAETLSDTFFVPVLDPGVYDLVVNDEADNELTTSYTVTEGISLTATPDEAAIGYNISFYGENFAAQNMTDLTWYVYNSTWSDEITGMVNYTDTIIAIEVSEHGNFTGIWTVPDSLILNLTVPNIYHVNATDDEGLYAETTITIVEEEVEIRPTASTYSLGDTITFRIRATFKKIGSYLEIRDPEDELYFMSMFSSSEWTVVEPWKVVQIRNQVDEASGYPYMIPTDAMIGEWSWSLFDADDEVIANGTITVLPTTAAQVDQRLTALEGGLSDLADDIAGVTSELEDEIDSLSDQISDVSSEVDDLKTEIVSDLADDIAEAKDAAAAAGAAVADLEDTVSDIADTAADAKSSADSAKTSAEAAKTAAEDAKTATSGLQTLVYAAIGASLIAAVAAVFGIMQLSSKLA